MVSSKVEPIRKSVVVNAGVERAFALFVERFDVIKPREHNLLAVPIAETGRASSCMSRLRALFSRGTLDQLGNW